MTDSVRAQGKVYLCFFLKKKQHQVSITQIKNLTFVLSSVISLFQKDTTSRMALWVVASLMFSDAKSINPVKWIARDGEVMPKPDDIITDSEETLRIMKYDVLTSPNLQIITIFSVFENTCSASVSEHTMSK